MNYIDIPIYTTLNEIVKNNYTLSATQYKSLQIKNKNIVPLKEFLVEELEKKYLGKEVGSESYIEKSSYYFIKTKALQRESYLLDITGDSIRCITPHNFKDMGLKAGDLLISKDSNVGEIVILDKDYPNTMLCSGIYKLPIKNEYKYYCLAFIKSDLFRQQIDFLVPRGSTIKHGKTKFLDCMLPLPNKNQEEIIKYIEVLMQAIIYKEIAIKNKHIHIIKSIQQEIEKEQNECIFSYSLPTINEIMNADRMDSSLYSEEFKKNEFTILNYKYGCSTVKELGFDISRGQNLQVSNIGKSIQTDQYVSGYYKLILPNFLTRYGTVNTIEYLGNSNLLKTLKEGDIIFGAEGNEKGRSIVIIENEDMTITNIHGITLNHNNNSLQKGIFIKLFLDYYRSKGMIDAYAVGGNGGSLAIKYWEFLKFPNFPDEKEKEITKLYYNKDIKYDTSICDVHSFADYNKNFDSVAGIYNLDQAIKYLKKKLDNAIKSIINDEEVNINY